MQSSNQPQPQPQQPQPQQFAATHRLSLQVDRVLDEMENDRASLHVADFQSRRAVLFGMLHEISVDAFSCFPPRQSPRCFECAEATTAHSSRGGANTYGDARTLGGRRRPPSRNTAPTAGRAPAYSGEERRRNAGTLGAGRASHAPARLFDGAAGRAAGLAGCGRPDPRVGLASSDDGNVLSRGDRAEDPEHTRLRADELGA